MSIKDFFSGSKYKKELDDLKSTFTPEMREAANIKKLIENLNQEVSSLQYKIETLDSDIAARTRSISDLDSEIANKKTELIETDEKILLQEFGLYEPTYDFANSEQYNDRLTEIRSKQKEMIKNNTAANGNMQWTVNGSLSKGRSMVKDTQKLLLRAFNSECDELVNKVKFNNFESCKKRIIKSCDIISKLGKTMLISISPEYLTLKLDELILAFEYRQKKQEEKEHLRYLREQAREEAKLKKELEEARKKIKKEKEHYENALSAMDSQIANADPSEVEALLNKRSEIIEQLNEINKSEQDLDYREANQRAGYVYVISNIGSFGEDDYKIGMTRRLDPMERINELSVASVPFNFDVHAMIFSDDAPALEAALHRAFANRKLNMVNQRKEFFNVSLNEIKSVVKSHFDKTVEFIDYPDAEQYRTSLKMKDIKPIE